MKKKQILILILIVLFLIYFIGFRQALLFAVGVGYGLVLAGVGFGFTTGWRRLIEKGDAGGIAAQFFLILLLFLLSLPILLFSPQISPANASISYSLLLGAFFFGLFMQLADGCGSGTLFKAGGLKSYNLWIMAGFILGAFWGSLDIPYWLSWGEIFPIFNFIRGDLAWGGYKIGWVIELILILAAWLYFQIRSNRKNAGEGGGNGRVLKGAAALAVLAWFNLIIAGQPWGIVYGLGLWGAKAAQGLGLPVSESIYWGAGYSLESLKNSVLLDATSITNIGLLLGAFVVASNKPQPIISPSSSSSPSSASSPISQSTQLPQNKRKFVLRRPAAIISIVAIFAIIAIGTVLGYSSRLAFGCNIGAFVSGISTGSLHGWVWVVMAFAGTTIGVRLRKTPLIRYLQSY